MESWDNLVQDVVNLISSREKYQRKLGGIAGMIMEEGGFQALADFASEVKEIAGKGISPRTLENYAWVYKKTSNLKLPEDLPYVSLQYIASSKNPKAWAKRIKKEGLSGADIIRLIRIEKGLIPERKIATCPHCGTKFGI